MDQLLQIVFHTIQPGVIIEFIMLILLLLGSALMSASEVAFFALKPAQIKELESGKHKRGALVLKLLEHPEKLLANILIGNNFVNISIIILSTNITLEIADFSHEPLLGFIFQVVIVTLLILLVGEIIPKVFATDNSVKVALFMAIQLDILSKIFYPVTQLLLSSTSFVQKRFELKKPNISMDDLSDAIEITSPSLSDEKKLLKGIVKFGNTDVSEIMQPRIDILALEYNSTLSKLFSTIVETGYSRIPVYEDNLDHIKGILLTKDLLPYLNEDNTFNWQGLIKPAFFVPENKKIDDLLAEFQKKKIHLAIVIDEYGGTCGLVTLEDILEEIIGEINDESDVEEELLFKKLSANTYLFEGKILLNDFYKAIGTDDSPFDDVKGEYETLAGLILELKGEIPFKGDRIEYKNFIFIIETVDKRRIRQVKVILKNQRNA